MAGRRKTVTMQGVGSPVSATGQSGKAGSQLSSSCDRSAVLVGNLAGTGYDATRRCVPQVHRCSTVVRDSFCLICAEFEITKNRKPLTQGLIDIYNKAFNLNFVDVEWAPHIVCNSCRTMLIRWNTKPSAIKFDTPATWRQPSSKNDCYFCMTDAFGFNTRQKKKYMQMLYLSLNRAMQMKMKVNRWI